MVVGKSVVLLEHEQLYQHDLIGVRKTTPLGVILFLRWWDGSGTVPDQSDLRSRSGINQGCESSILLMENDVPERAP